MGWAGDHVQPVQGEGWAWEEQAKRHVEQTTEAELRDRATSDLRIYHYISSFYETMLYPHTKHLFTYVDLGVFLFHKTKNLDENTSFYNMIQCAWQRLESISTLQSAI